MEYVTNNRRVSVKQLLNCWSWLLITLSLCSCEKYQKQILVKTGTIESVSYKSASVMGEIVDVGEGILQYGHCWAISPEVPTSELETKSEFEDTDQPFQYVSSLLNLNPDSEYKLRAYAIDKKGESHYGPEILSIQTLAQTSPAVITLNVSSVTSGSVSCGGNITADGGAEIIHCGICWSEDPNPTIDDFNSSESRNSLGEFTITINGLTPGIKYYFRAFAINDIYKIGYGADKPYTTR